MLSIVFCAVDVGESRNFFGFIQIQPQEAGNEFVKMTNSFLVWGYLLMIGFNRSYPT